MSGSLATGASLHDKTRVTMHAPTIGDARKHYCCTSLWSVSLLELQRSALVGRCNKNAPAVLPGAP